MKNANPVSRRYGLIAWLLAAVWLTGCGRAEPAAETPLGADHHFTINVGEKPVEMQLAIAPPEMMRGLMERGLLGRHEGMLFVYTKPQQMSFWMRNTPNPLDIGFFDAEGVLREVYQMYPYDETAVKSRRTDLQYALEMNQGWFAATGVKIGDKLDLAAVAAGVKARGFPLRGFLGLSEAAAK